MEREGGKRERREKGKRDGEGRRKRSTTPGMFGKLLKTYLSMSLRSRGHMSLALEEQIKHTA